MKEIEVKLRGETRYVEFDKPVLSFDIPTTGFYRSRNFWLGVLIGIFITAILIFKFFPNEKGGTSDVYENRINQLEQTRKIYAAKLKQEGWHWYNGKWIKNPPSP